MAETVESFYQVNTPALLAFPHVLDPAPFKGANGKPKGDPKYSATFPMKADHPDIAGLKSKVIEVAKAKWPGRDIIAAAKAGDLKLPFTSGDKMLEKRMTKIKADGKDYDGRSDFLKGTIVFKAKSDYPPSLGVVVNKAIVEVTPDNKAVHRGVFYFGTDCLFRLNFRAYDGVDGGKDGVTAYLDMVLSLNRGPRLSGQRTATEAFKGVVGNLSAEDPTAGAAELDDEIPF